MGLSKHVVLFPFIILLNFLETAKPLDLKFQQHDYQLEFERMELVRFNKSYLKSYTVKTFKYNRTTPLVNISYEYSIDINYENEIIIQAYTFLSNEYRYFPMRFEVNFCEALSKNYVGIATFPKCGGFTGCPLKKDIIYNHCNWAPDPSQFPPLIPNGRYMLELQGLYHDTELWLIRAYAKVDRPFVGK